MFGDTDTNDSIRLSIEERNKVTTDENKEIGFMTWISVFCGT